MSGGRLISNFIKQPQFCSAIRLFFFFYFSDVSFEFNSVVYCKFHSLWELTDFVSFPGAVVVFVVCRTVLCDKNSICIGDDRRRSPK